MINLKKMKDCLQREKNPLLLSLDYEEFKQYIGYIKDELGDSGMVMFAENVAMIYFDNIPLLRLKIKHNHYYVRDDFDILGKRFEIIGQGPDMVQSSPKMFAIDIKNNLWKIFLILLLFVIAVNPLSYNIEPIRFLDEKLIDVVGIFIGMVFIFIGFFYGDKERTIDAYKKGLCHTEFVKDRYVINLAIVDMAILCFSILFSYLRLCDIPVFIKNISFLQDIMNSKSKYWICCGLTGVSLIIMVIEFDALINCYLKDIRNKYFIDAFESRVSERK